MSDAYKINKLMTGRCDWNTERYNINLSKEDIPLELIKEYTQEYPEVSFETLGQLYDNSEVYHDPLIEYTEIVYKDGCSGITLAPENFEVFVVNNGQVYDYFTIVVSKDYKNVYKVIRSGPRLKPTEKSELIPCPDDRKDGLNTYEITREIKDTTKLLDDRDGDYSKPRLVVETPYHVTCTSSTSKDGEDFTTFTWTTHSNTLEEAEKEINDWLIEHDIK